MSGGLKGLGANPLAARMVLSGKRRTFAPFFYVGMAYKKEDSL